jgi:hypothetical protein
MAPVLKLDPISGESLDKAKTPEQIAAEQAANEKFYNERKKKVKSKVKKQPRLKYEPIINFNPILDPNKEPAIEEMLESFNNLLKPAQTFLKKENKKYNVKKFIEPYSLTLHKPVNSLRVNYNSDYTINKHIPLDMIYLSNVSVTPSNYDVFPEPSYSKRFLYVDRVMLNPFDVNILLKTPAKSKIILANLIKQMYNNLIVTKNLQVDKKYKGELIASLYCLNYKDEFVELRLASDITEIIE